MEHSEKQQEQSPAGATTEQVADRLDPEPNNGCSSCVDTATRAVLSAANHAIAEGLQHCGTHEHTSSRFLQAVNQDLQANQQPRDQT